MDLTRVEALSFDCYGTLIDWETGILAVLRPWATEAGIDADDESLLAAFAESEAAAERELPTLRYPNILAEAFRRVGTRLGAEVNDEWASRLGGSVGDWPAFDDSPAALATLAAHYTLIIVSNVHREGFAASNRRLHGRFAAVITAEDVGAYKPADPHFDALDRTIAELGIEPDQSLHVAQSLFHDHGPARRPRNAVGVDQPARRSHRQWGDAGRSGRVRLRGGIRVDGRVRRRRAGGIRRHRLIGGRRRASVSRSCGRDDAWCG